MNEKYTKRKKSEDEEIPVGSYSVEQILGEKNYTRSDKAVQFGNRAALHSTPPH